MTADAPGTRLDAVLWPNGGAQNVWAIVDGARDRRIWTTLHSSSMTYACLYSGPIARELEKAAPHLVRLEYQHRDSIDLIRAGWGNSWGVFFRSESTFDGIRRHFRKLLSVQDAGGRPLLFRYYDPRVLRVYLPTCRSDELRTVFGPVECFLVEEESHRAIEFRLGGIGLLRKSLAVSVPPV